MTHAITQLHSVAQNKHKGVIPCNTGSYSTVADDLDKYISGDKVHFNPYGVKVQAEQVAKVIAVTLQTKK